MALIITPGQLSRQAEFYHQLGAMMGAGMTLVQALEQLLRSPPSPFFRRPLRSLLDQLGQGATFAEAVAHTPDWLPSFDHALVEAGEQSGRLDATFHLLSGYYADRAKLARQVISDMAYPLFLLHFAVLLAPIPKLFTTGNLAAYLGETLSLLLPPWIAFWFLLFACQGRRGVFWRRGVESVLRPLPVIGKARRHLALARLSVALEALLNAGVSILSAWPLAAAASGSPALQRAVAQWQGRLLAGETPGELLRQTSAFPEMFANLYAAGELSGTTDDTLRRLQKYYQDDASRKLHALAQWLPRFIYLIILVVIGLRIIGFWTGYYGGMTDRVDEFMQQ